MKCFGKPKMMKSRLFRDKIGPLVLKFGPIQNRSCAILTDGKIEACYNILNIPVNSKQSTVRKAFLDLAKIYHPDSGSPQASVEKFVDIENAFRILTQHNTGRSSKEEVEKIVHDIKHTAPQHRQYLSFDGVGYGTPFQRQRQWEQARAHRAASNVMEHRVAKAVASENTLMKKGQGYKKTHDIKTKYGFDRLVEDLIQESMSKGEFDKLSGQGKPLKEQNTNPYVDFTTHKLNEELVAAYVFHPYYTQRSQSSKAEICAKVLINNGFVPEWITMNKEIDEDIQALKEELKRDRMYLGPCPLSDHDQFKWSRLVEANRDLAKSINTKINKYNLIVPLLNKQKLHVEFERICEDVLTNGIHSVKAEKEKPTVVAASVSEPDIFGVFFKVIGDLFTFSKSKKNIDN